MQKFVVKKSWKCTKFKTFLYVWLKYTFSRYPASKTNRNITGVNYSKWMDSFESIQCLFMEKTKTNIVLFVIPPLDGAKVRNVEINLNWHYILSTNEPVWSLWILQSGLKKYFQMQFQCRLFTCKRGCCVFDCWWATAATTGCVVFVRAFILPAPLSMYLPTCLFSLLFCLQPMKTMGRSLSHTHTHRYLSEMPSGGYLCFPDTLHQTDNLLHSL